MWDGITIESQLDGGNEQPPRGREELTCSTIASSTSSPGSRPPHWPGPRYPTLRLCRLRTCLSACASDSRRHCAAGPTPWRRPTASASPRPRSRALAVKGWVVARPLDETLDERQGGVGDLAPAAVDGEGVPAVLDLDDLGHALVVLLLLVGRVGDRPRDGVVPLT